MADQTLTCKDCQNPFVFTDRDQAFFTQQGFTPPKRCKPCRDENKRRLEQQKAAGQAPAAPAPSYDDERNGHRKKGGRDRRGGGQRGHW